MVEDDKVLPADRLWSIDEVSYFLGCLLATHLAVGRQAAGVRRHHGRPADDKPCDDLAGQSARRIGEDAPSSGGV